MNIPVEQLAREAPGIRISDDPRIRDFVTPTRRGVVLVSAVETAQKTPVEVLLDYRDVRSKTREDMAADGILGDPDIFAPMGSVKLPLVHFALSTESIKSAVLDVIGREC